MPLFAKRPREGPPFLFATIWLAYLAFPLYSLFQQTFEEMIIGIGFVILFAACYLLSYPLSRLRIFLIAAQIILIGVACIRYDASFVYMAFYPSPIIGMLSSTRQMVIALGMLVVLYLTVGYFDALLENSDMFVQLLPVMLITLFMPIAMRIGRRSRQLRNELSVANEEISRLSKQEERQRISRDLHDTLGHTLSLITLKSELAEKLITRNPERAVQEVRDIQTTSRAALKQVRELVMNMSAVTLQSEVEHAKQILAAAGIELTLQGEVQAPASSPIIDNIAGMCLREAVTNIVKHSRAKACTIERTERAESTVLTIADNGVGVPDISDCEHKATSGLRGMRERLKLIEGLLSLEAGEQGGLRIRMTIPKVTKAITIDN